MKYFLFLFLLLITGCVPAQKGGFGRIWHPSGFVGEVHQSENPKNNTTQDYERITETDTPTPTGVVHTKIVERSGTKIGASQKDTAREIGARLSSLKGVVWVGILLFIFGAASAVYPPLKLIVGSLTTSVVCIISGVALIALPSVIVGHELVLIGVGVGAVALYWFAHRHASIHSALKSITGK